MAAFTERSPMNACHTLLAAPVSLVCSLISRIVAFLAPYIRGFGRGETRATTVQTKAQIVACAARLLARAGNLERLATRPVRRVRGGDGARQAGDADRGVVRARAAPALAEPGRFLWQQTLPRRVPGRISTPAGRLVDRQRRQAPATAGVTRALGKTRSKLRKRVQTWSCPRAATGGSSRPVANFRQAFATGVRALRSR